MKRSCLTCLLILSLFVFFVNSVTAQLQSGQSIKIRNIDVGEITLNPALEKVLSESIQEGVNEYSKRKNKPFVVLDSSRLNNGYIKVPKEFIKCMDKSDAPQSISDLSSGLTLDAYSFDRENQGKLGFLGFGNVEIKKKETVIVVEYKQTGYQRCDGYNLFYGIGARIMMHIKNNKKGAKINTPQQVSASVIFGKADVTFSIKTFGITGPGVSRLVKAGTLNENTYVEFLNEISNLIVDAYKQESSFNIDPQPLFLKQY